LEYKLIEGHEHTKWKIRCRSVYEKIASRYPSVNPVEAGKIVKKAFPLVKRQNYHPSNCISESYYDNIRESKLNAELEATNTKHEEKETNVLQEKEGIISQMNKCVTEKEELIESKVKKLKRLERNYSHSLESIRTLTKQNMALSRIVNDLEEQRLKQRNKVGQNVYSTVTVNL
jgi:hypothetical protein